MFELRLLAEPTDHSSAACYLSFQGGLQVKIVSDTLGYFVTE
jgi:hypothetical protein